MPTAPTAADIRRDAANIEFMFGRIVAIDPTDDGLHVTCEGRAGDRTVYAAIPAVPPPGCAPYCLTAI